MNVVNSKIKKPLPTFLIDLKPQENNNEIFNINYCAEQKLMLKWQFYGHWKTHCTRPYNWVKCDKEHDTKVYKKLKDTPDKCALCQGNCPASYKGCIAYRYLVASTNRIQPSTQNSTTVTTSQNTHVVNFLFLNRNFA